jgi:two-component system sensor histidine kinase CiaH
MAVNINFLKRSEGSATGSEHNLFNQARLRLTLFYVAVITLILVIASLVLFYSIAQDMQEEVEGEFVSEKAQTVFVEKTITGLETKIFMIDSLVIIMIAGLSYWLAGKTLQPIQRSLTSQKRFVADASHELKTPLTIMKSNLEVAMRKASQKGNNNPILAVNLEEVERMNKIVEDLLTLSRIDNNQEQLQFSRTDISLIASDSVEKLRGYAENRNVDMQIQTENSLYVFGDYYRLEQAFINIVKNAIDYSSQEGKVFVSVEQAYNQAIISFQDNGIGMESEEQKHIFDRFYRIDKSRSRKQGGSGLGLSIVKWIIDQHHGSISVQSTLGNGTKVIISLPLLLSS